MKKLFFVVACIIVIINTVKLEEEEPNVYILTEENFPEAQKQFDYLFVKFHAPWCGHCKQLTPEFNKAAEIIKNKELNVGFGSVDITEQESLSDKFQIQGLPTIILFFRDEMISYQQNRSSEEIVKWLQIKISFKSIEVNEVQDLEKIIAENELTLVYFGEKNNEFEQYLKIGQQLDVTIAHTFSQLMKDHYKASKLVLFKPFDEKRNDYLESDLTIEKVLNFIAIHSLPTIMNFTEQSAAIIFGEGKDGFIIFFNQELHKQQLEEFVKASETLKGKILMVKSQIVSQLEKRLAEFIGITESDLPIAYIINTNSPIFKKFQLQNEITSNNLLQFYQHFLAGKLTPTYKSEAIPLTNERPIITLVGKTFKQIVLDQTKDVLVKFYAPNCQHCKDLVPIYQQASERLKQSKNLIIAEYNAIANENEEINIQGFPTIQFFATHAKSDPVTFDGQHSVEEIVSFVKQYATLAIIDTKAIMPDQKKPEVQDEL